MAPLTFADTHNMVAFLSKSDFWATVLIKKANDVVKLRALIDGNWVIVTEDVIRQVLRFDDADGVECLPNEEIFTELTHDLSSHSNQYKSPALTQKVLANMHRVGKGFSGVETPLFATMLVQPQPPAAEEEDKEEEVPNAPTPPSPTTKPLPPLQEPIPTPPQAQPAPSSSPPQEQPTPTSKSFMTLLNTLIETCATLSQKVAALEQDKIAQALEICKLKRRVKKLE
nr:hypothetical protein [Tanacetum cinerariifolium]